MTNTITTQIYNISLHDALPIYQTRMILRIKESFKGDSHKLSVDNNKKYVWFVPDDFQKPKDIEIPDMKKAEPF